MSRPAESSLVSQASSAFHFLVSEHGFSGPTVRGSQPHTPAMVGDDFEAVRFESNRVFVSIWRCPSRLEWDVEKLLPKALAERAEVLKAVGPAALVGDLPLFQKVSAAPSPPARARLAV